MRQETRRAALTAIGRASFPGFVLRRVARTRSTQDVVRDLARGGAAEGVCCLAGEQTRGRGRQGRPWIAPAGSSMLASILLRRTPAAAGGVPIAAGLAVADAVESLAAVHAGLKWPNDVLVDGLKVAGVLAEAEADDAEPGLAVVLGIGLNLSSRAVPPGVAATSLEDAAGAPAPTATEALRALLPLLRARLDQLEAGGIVALLPHWRTRAVGLGGAVVASTPAGRIEGIARDLDSDGALLVETAAGVRRLVAGDVSIVRGSLGKAPPEPG